MGKMKRVDTGHVTSIDAHSDGKHLNVTVKHGRKKRKSKKEAWQYDDRPTSNFVVPKEHAKKYHIGQRLDIAATDPAQAAVDEDGAGDAQDLDTVGDMKSKAASGLFNATNRR